jgi:hypothetical protein
MTNPKMSPAEQQYNLFKKARIQHWDQVAEKKLPLHAAGYYHHRLEEVYRFLIPPGMSVIELGCGDGSLLASLKPGVGVGIDFSEKMIAAARSKYPQYQFETCDAMTYQAGRTFDFIILSDLLNDLWDVQSVLENVYRLCHPRTRIIFNIYSRLWQGGLTLGQKLGMARPTLEQNWLTVDDVENLCRLAGFEMIRAWQDILAPFSLLSLERLFNSFLVKLWPFNEFALTNFIIARPLFAGQEKEAPSVSIIVPARNEAGNIPAIFQRTPRMGEFTELVFVEGHSQDQTSAAIQAEMLAHPEWRTQLMHQSGRGKGDAVRMGFDCAQGDILMILDADLTVPPETLPRFYDAIVSGKGDFVNGVRLVYPMEKEAMRFFNFLGNKFFSIAFSWLVGQPVKDTLCGTKVLWRRDYEVVASNRAYFGDFDPFGDFDLLFGAARFNFKIVDLPIRYAERTYGTTNIQRWKHGLLLLKMVAFASRRIKFV